MTLLTPLTVTGMDNLPDVSELAPYFVDGQNGYPLDEIIDDVPRLKATLAHIVFGSKTYDSMVQSPHGANPLLNPQSA